MRKGIFTLLAMLIIGGSFNNSFATIIIPAATTAKPDPAAIEAAILGFKSLPKNERKERIKEIKKEIKAYKAAKKAGMEPSTNTLLLVILAILLPPLAVYLFEGKITSHFWISLILTLLFWLPGVIYALVIILGNK